MNLEQTKETILLWIRSCRTNEQLGLIIQVIQSFIIMRFEGTIPAWELEVAKNDLMDGWTEQSKVVAKTPQMEDMAPTLALHLQEEYSLKAFAD